MAPPEFGQMMIVNEIDKPVWAFLSVLRHKDAPPYSQKEKARLAALSVWFGRAVQIFRAAEAARTASSEVSGVIMVLSSPMALVNRDGKLVEINGAGDAVLGLHDGDIWEEPDGWHKALEVARKSGHGLHCDFIIGGRNQSLRLSRLPGSDELILVEFAIEAHHPIVAMDRFCGHYGLTRAERQVLGGLIEGAPISHLSQVLERGRETVKSQLRSIREKTGMKSQLAIVSSFQRFKDLTAA